MWCSLAQEPVTAKDCQGKEERLLYYFKVTLVFCKCVQCTDKEQVIALNSHLWAQFDEARKRYQYLGNMAKYQAPPIHHILILLLAINILPTAIVKFPFYTGWSPDFCITSIRVNSSKLFVMFTNFIQLY